MNVEPQDRGYAELHNGVFSRLLRFYRNVTGLSRSWTIPMARPVAGAIIKTLVFTLIVPGSVVVLVPWWILQGRGAVMFSGAGVASLVLIVIGGAIYFRCAWEFAYSGLGTPAPIDPPKVLIARGFNRFVRNPMYGGVTTIVVGEALLFHSRELLIYAACLWLAFHFFVILYEEPALTRKFGAAYDDYRRTVPRWLPRFRRT